MDHLNWSDCSALEKNGEADGEWVFKGTQIPAKVVFDNLAAGMPPLEISRLLGVDQEAVAAVLRFTGESLPTDSDLQRRIKNNRIALARIGILPTLWFGGGALRMGDTHPVIAPALWVCAGGLTLIILAAALPFRRWQLLLIRNL